jgi:hypothetical protein
MAADDTVSNEEVFGGTLSKEEEGLSGEKE